MTDLWEHVKGLKGKPLHTLARSHPFVILDVTNSMIHLKVLSTQRERTITRKSIEAVYKELRQRGEISGVEILIKHKSRSSAYVCAILASLPEVTHNTSPIRLKLK